MLPRFSAILPTTETTGDFEEMCLTGGGNSANIYDLRPGGRILRHMMAEAERMITSRLHPATAR